MKYLPVKIGLMMRRNRIIKGSFLSKIKNKNKFLNKSSYVLKTLSIK